jgi:hypothetical protein
LNVLILKLRNKLLKEMYKQNLHNEILLHETSAPVWDVGSQTVFKPERNNLSLSEASIASPSIATI